MEPATGILFDYRCDAEPALSEAEVFIVLINIEQLRRPDIHWEVCRRIAADSYRLLCVNNSIRHLSLHPDWKHGGRFSNSMV